VSYSPGSGWAVGPTVGTLGWSLTASGSSCSPLTTTTHTSRQTPRLLLPLARASPLQISRTSTASRTQEDKSFMASTVYHIVAYLRQAFVQESGLSFQRLSCLL
jgi:hypothetical protein